MSYGVNEAYEQIKVGQSKMAEAQATDDAALKDSLIRSAFYNLYMAVRKANMVYNSMFKGSVDATGGSFTWVNDELDVYAKTLFRSYYTQGAYPKEDTAKWFDKWLQRTKGIVDRLASECPLGENTQSVEAWVEERDHGYMRHHEDEELMI